MKKEQIKKWVEAFKAKHKKKSKKQFQSWINK